MLFPQHSGLISECDKSVEYMDKRPYTIIILVGTSISVHVCVYIYIYIYLYIYIYIYPGMDTGYGKGGSG